MQEKVSPPAVAVPSVRDRSDQIIASQYLLLPTIDEMKVHAFESLDPEFPVKVKPGDFVVGGENFGCGSSRECSSEFS